MSGGAVQRSSIQLYRDCLRLVRHIAPGPRTPKAVALRRTLRTEFVKNKNVTDQDMIDSLKANAVRALSNYLLTMQGPKDSKIAAAAKDFHGRSVREAQEHQQADTR